MADTSEWFQYEIILLVTLVWCSPVNKVTINQGSIRHIEVAHNTA